MKTRGILIHQPSDALDVEPGRYDLEPAWVEAARLVGAERAAALSRRESGAGVRLADWANEMSAISGQAAQHFLRLSPQVGGSASVGARDLRAEIRRRAYAVLSRASVALRWPRDAQHRSPEDVDLVMGVGDADGELATALRLIAQDKIGWMTVRRAQAVVPRYAPERLGGVPAHVGRVPGEGLDLDVMRVGLDRYRRGAARHAPWLLDRGAPFVIEPYASEAHGYYTPYDATVHLHAPAFRAVRAVAHVAAHEQGHAVWREVLDEAAREAWAEATHGRSEPIDLDRLKEAWSRFGRYAPLNYVAVDISDEVRRGVFGAQVTSLARRPELRDLDLASFLRLAEQGAILVPEKPVSDYGTVSPEEAFCEALGSLVGEGPATLDAEHLDLLERTVPTARVSNPGPSGGAPMPLWVDRCEGRHAIAVVAWSHPTRRQRRDVAASVEARPEAVADPDRLPRIGKATDSVTYVVSDSFVSPALRGRGLGVWLYAEAARLAALHGGSLAADRRGPLGSTTDMAERVWASRRLGSLVLLDREGFGAAWPIGVREPSASRAPLPGGFVETR